jgi:hypothetical protein
MCYFQGLPRYKCILETEPNPIIWYFKIGIIVCRFYYDRLLCETTVPFPSKTRGLTAVIFSCRASRRAGKRPHPCPVKLDVCGSEEHSSTSLRRQWTTAGGLSRKASRIRTEWSWNKKSWHGKKSAQLYNGSILSTHGNGAPLSSL